jgi:hypothetical protein
LRGEVGFGEGIGLGSSGLNFFSSLSCEVKIFAYLCTPVRKERGKGSGLKTENWIERPRSACFHGIVGRSSLKCCKRERKPEKAGLAKLMRVGISEGQ